MLQIDEVYCYLNMNLGKTYLVASVRPKYMRFSNIQNLRQFQRWILYQTKVF